MIKEFIKKFEHWDITEKDVKIDTFRKNICGNYYSNGVSLEIEKFRITVSSYTEKTQKDNLKRCFEIMESILNNYIL